MRRCKWAAIGLAFTAWTAAPLRGELQQDVDKTRVTKLIQQLGDEDFARREAAGAALARLGEPVVPALRLAAAASGDAEIRARATAILHAAGVPNPKLAGSSIEMEAAVLQFLDRIKGKSRHAVLERFGHPCEVEWNADGAESWTYSRTDGHLFRVFFRNGSAISYLTPELFGGLRFQY
jgi:hypothetical protein